MTYTKKILDNGEWVTVDPKEITENGITDTKEVKAVDVNVSGGGSSDFSTAEVTFINSGEGPYFVEPFPYVFIGDQQQYIAATGNYYVSSADGNLFTVVLYNNELWLSCREYDRSVSPVLSGDVVYDSDEEAFIVSGDCFITLKGLGDDTSA